MGQPDATGKPKNASAFEDVGNGGPPALAATVNQTERRSTVTKSSLLAVVLAVSLMVAASCIVNAQIPPAAQTVPAPAPTTTPATTLTATAIEKPEAPVDFTANGGVGRVELSWRPNEGASATSYAVTCQSSSVNADKDNTWTPLWEGAATKLAVDTSGWPTGKYRFRVVARNAGGTSEPAGNYAITANPADTPAPPQLFRLDLGKGEDGKTAVSWTPDPDFWNRVDIADLIAADVGRNARKAIWGNPRFLETLDTWMLPRDAKGRVRLDVLDRTCPYITQDGRNWGWSIDTAKKASMPQLMWEALGKADASARKSRADLHKVKLAMYGQMAFNVVLLLLVAFLLSNLRKRG